LSLLPRRNAGDVFLQINIARSGIPARMQFRRSALASVKMRGFSGQMSDRRIPPITSNAKSTGFPVLLQYARQDSNLQVAFRRRDPFGPRSATGPPIEVRPAGLEPATLGSEV